MNTYKRHEHIPDELIQRLQGCFQGLVSRDPEVVSTAARTLCQISYGVGIPDHRGTLDTAAIGLFPPALTADIFTLYQNHTDKPRHQLLRAIARWCGEDTLHSVMNSVRSNGADVDELIYVIAMLQSIGGSYAVEQIRSLQHHAEPRVKQRATLALESLEGCTEQHPSVGDDARTLRDHLACLDDAPEQPQRQTIVSQEQQNNVGELHQIFRNRLTRRRHGHDSLRDAIFNPNTLERLTQSCA